MEFKLQSGMAFPAPGEPGARVGACSGATRVGAARRTTAAASLDARPSPLGRRDVRRQARDDHDVVGTGATDRGSNACPGAHRAADGAAACRGCRQAQSADGVEGQGRRGTVVGERRARRSGAVPGPDRAGSIRHLRRLRLHRLPTQPVQLGAVHQLLPQPLNRSTLVVTACVRPLCVALGRDPCCVPARVHTRHAGRRAARALSCPSALLARYRRPGALDGRAPVAFFCAVTWVSNQGRTSPMIDLASTAVALQVDHHARSSTCPVCPFVAQVLSAGSIT